MELLLLPILLFILAATVLALGMLAAGALFGPHRTSSAKRMPYESGMDPLHDTRRRFDVRFHLVAIAFLIFDVELLFLYPWAVAGKHPEGLPQVAASAGPAAAAIARPVSRVVDDGAPRFSAGDGFAPSADERGLGARVLMAQSGGGDAANWSFPGLADGSYLVSVTWPASQDASSDTLFTAVATGGATLERSLNQQHPPDDFADATGLFWSNLGRIEVSGGEGNGAITVTLSDTLGPGLMVADGARVVEADFSTGLVFGEIMFFLALLTLGWVYGWRRGVFRWR